MLSNADSVCDLVGGASQWQQQQQQQQPVATPPAALAKKTQPVVSKHCSFLYVSCTWPLLVPGTVVI